MPIGRERSLWVRLRKRLRAEEPTLIRRRDALEDGRIQLECFEDSFAPLVKEADVREGEARAEGLQCFVVRDLHADEVCAFLAIARKAISLERPHEIAYRPQ